MEIKPVKIIVTALLLFFLLLTFVVEIRRINGSSMEPTIGKGELVLVNKMAYGLNIPFRGGYLFRWGHPAAGEIVAARHPVEKKIIVKRCLATAGENIQISDKFLIIGQRSIPAGSNNLKNTIQYTPVPDDKILIIGDNYVDSIDSRAFGYLPESEVIGRVILFNSGK